MFGWIGLGWIGWDGMWRLFSCLVAFGFHLFLSLLGAIYSNSFSVTLSNTKPQTILQMDLDPTEDVEMAPQPAVVKDEEEDEDILMMDGGAGEEEEPEKESDDLLFHAPESLEIEAENGEDDSSAIMRYLSGLEGDWSSQQLVEEEEDERAAEEGDAEEDEDAAAENVYMDEDEKEELQFQRIAQAELERQMREDEEEVLLFSSLSLLLSYHFLLSSVLFLFVWIGTFVLFLFCFAFLCHFSLFFFRPHTSLFCF